MMLMIKPDEAWMHIYATGKVPEELMLLRKKLNWVFPLPLTFFPLGECCTHPQRAKAVENWPNMASCPAYLEDLYCDGSPYHRSSPRFLSISSSLVSSVGKNLPGAPSRASNSGCRTSSRCTSIWATPHPLGYEALSYAAPACHDVLYRLTCKGAAQLRASGNPILYIYYIIYIILLNVPEKWPKSGKEGRGRHSMYMSTVWQLSGCVYRGQRLEGWLNTASYTCVRLQWFSQLDGIHQQKDRLSRFLQIYIHISTQLPQKIVFFYIWVSKILRILRWFQIRGHNWKKVYTEKGICKKLLPVIIIDEDRLQFCTLVLVIQ